MKFIKTSNLALLKMWLVGGETDTQVIDGFHCLNRDNDHLKTNGEFDFEKVKEEVIGLIQDCGDMEDGYFQYFGDHYRFKLPGEHNLNLLLKRIIADLKMIEEWNEE